LYKWPLSRNLGIFFWISEPVLVQSSVFRIRVVDLQSICAVYVFGSWLGPSDENRLYAKNIQRIYTEYGTETRIEPTEAIGIYSFDFISYVPSMCS